MWGPDIAVDCCMLHLCTEYYTRALWPRVFHVVPRAIQFMKSLHNAAFMVMAMCLQPWPELAALHQQGQKIVTQAVLWLSDVCLSEH